MSYLNDPRENSIRVESGVTLESDNRIEQRWKWNGMILDLCNMNPDDYQKQYYTVIISGSTSGNTSQKVENSIAIEIKQEGGNICLYANAERYVSSDIYIVCDYSIQIKDGNSLSGSTNIMLAEGSKSATTIIQENAQMVSAQGYTYIGDSFESATSREFEDKEYIYKVQDVEADSIILFYGIFPYTGNVETLSLSLLSEIQSKEFDDYNLIYILPQGNGDLAESQDELDKETYNLILALPSTLKNDLIIKDFYLNVDITSQFINSSKTEVKNNIEYSFLIRNGKDELYTFNSSEREIPYKITIKK